ncbi:hypothetical protein H0H92_007005 [Tricholoma furcatifolium]|nr:hypothetical protein H0H92_007005 [Tricholoma furcatifolium]
MLALSRRILPAAARRTFTVSSIRSNEPQPPQLDGERLIEAKLKERFSPCQVKVQDVSGGCGSFYAINISSPAFAGLSVVKQHRLVTETLKEEMPGMHGLQCFLTGTKWPLQQPTGVAHVMPCHIASDSNPVKQIIP